MGTSWCVAALIVLDMMVLLLLLLLSFWIEAEILDTLGLMRARDIEAEDEMNEDTGTRYRDEMTDGWFASSLVRVFTVDLLSFISWVCPCFLKKYQPKDVCYGSRSKAVSKVTHAAPLCNNARHFKK
jgi:hypothetical protein